MWRWSAGVVAELRRQAATFESVCEDFFADIRRRGQRRAHQVEVAVRKEFVSRWGARPVTDIDWADVKTVIDAAIRRERHVTAHHFSPMPSASSAGRVSKARTD